MRPDVDGFIGQHKEAENNNKKLALSPSPLRVQVGGDALCEGWGGGGVEQTFPSCKQFIYYFVCLTLPTRDKSGPNSR